MHKEIKLKARICKGKNNVTSWSFIEVYVVGKWRPIRHYITKDIKIPSKKIQDAMRKTILVNTGLGNNGYEPTITFEWVEPNLD